MRGFLEIVGRIMIIKRHSYKNVNEFNFDLLFLTGTGLDDGPASLEVAGRVGVAAVVVVAVVVEVVVVGVGVEEAMVRSSNVRTIVDQFTGLNCPLR
jgi:uncharacterized transporter YbjL